MTIQKLSRREALKLGLAGLLSLKMTYPAHALGSSAADIAAYLTFNADHTVTLSSPFLEGGQGIFTGLAQIVAEDLDVEPTQCRVYCPPSNPALNLLNGLRFTGQSLSVRASYTMLRQLSATARAMLVQAAAQQWRVPASELMTQYGRVVHRTSKNALSYAALAPLAFKLPVPDNPPLRPRRAFKTIGHSIKRLDARVKSTGAAQYAIDLHIDGMLLAAVQHRPSPRHIFVRLKNRDAIAALSGVRSVETFPDFVAVVAERWWQAKRALAMLEIEWAIDAASQASAVSSQAYQDSLIQSVEKLPLSTPVANAHSDDRVEAIYSFPLLAHGQIEPPSATARFNTDGTLEIWTPNQSPDIFRDMAAKIAGLDPARVTIHTPFVGGFFGRYFYYGAPSPMNEAVILAQKLKRPVKVIWSREEEFLCDAYRPITAVRIAAALDRTRQTLSAIHATIAGEGVSGQLFGFSGKAPDETATEGLLSDAYDLANRVVEHHLVPSPVKIGYWRSVGHSSNNFATESFLDEIATTLKIDPVSFRLKLLEKNKRAAQVLKTVADRAGGKLGKPYRGSKQAACARGVALSVSFGSYIATIAEVTVRDGRPRVEKVWVAADVGIAINPDLVIAQLKSAIIMGLSATLAEKITIKDGVVGQSNFDSYPILGPDDAPEIMATLVPSDEAPGGVGEIGVPGIGPAVANALSSLTGRRIRTLPLSEAAPFIALPVQG